MNKLVKAKVYLEGLQVPFSRVIITEREGFPPVCSIIFASNDRFLSLLPKTVCFVFYHYDDEFRLVYTGELATVGFQKTGGSRNVSANFAGFTTNWKDTVMGVLGFGGENLRDMTDFYLIQGLPEIPEDRTRDTVIRDGNSKAGKPVKAGGPVWAKPPIPETVVDLTTKGWFFTNHSNTNTFFDLVYIKLKEQASKAVYNEGAGDSTTESYFSDGFDYITALFRNLNDFAVSSNPYYNILDKRTKLRERLYTIPNTKADDMFQKLVTFKNSPFQGHFRSLTGINSFSKVLQGVLDYFLYDISELAVPIARGPKFKNILLKPRMDYALPIKCNVIYPDDITNLSFSRNFEAEPTRMSAVVRPQLLRRGVDNAIAQYMFMTPEIWVNEKVRGPWTEGLEIDNTTVAPGLSYRELLAGMRGVMTGNPTSVELAFNEAEFPLEKQFPASDLAIVRGNEIGIEPGTDAEATEKNKLGLWSSGQIKKYIIKILEARFYDAKFNARTAAVTTSYNPSRMLGFPSLVIGEEKLSSLMGVIEGITSTIDANGNATQNITLGKVRIVNEQEELESTTESRVLRDLIPHFEYFYDPSFTPKDIGVKLYKDLMGWYKERNRDGSIYEYASSSMTSDSYFGVSEITYHAVAYLKGMLRNSTDRERQNFVFEQTKREIPTEAEAWRFLGVNPLLPVDHSTNVHSIADLAGKEFDDEKLREVIINDPEGTGTRKLFVKERQDAVRNIMLTNDVEVN